MDVAIAGAGAMGCRLGWMLDRAGARVVLLDGWREHVEAINRDGLVVHDAGAAHVVRLEARAFPLTEPVDLLVVFSKAMHTAQTMAACQGALRPDTWVMTLQNGLGNVQAIERHVAHDRIIVGTTTSTAELVGPGRVRALGAGSTELMALDPEAGGAIAEILDLLADAGLDVHVGDDVMGTVWAKVAFNAALNALCAVLRVPVGALPRYAELTTVVAAIVDEVVAVAAADGVRLDRERVLARIERQYDPAVASDHLPSMLLDVLRGQETEVDQLNGAVVRIADEAGLAVPCNRLMAHLLRMTHATRDVRVSDLEALTG